MSAMTNADPLLAAAPPAAAAPSAAPSSAPSAGPAEAPRGMESEAALLSVLAEVPAVSRAAARASAGGVVVTVWPGEKGSVAWAMGHGKWDRWCWDGCSERACDMFSPGQGAGLWWDKQRICGLWWMWREGVRWGRATAWGCAVVHDKARNLPARRTVCEVGGDGGLARRLAPSLGRPGPGCATSPMSSGGSRNALSCLSPPSPAALCPPPCLQATLQQRNLPANAQRRYTVTAALTPGALQGQGGDVTALLGVPQVGGVEGRGQAFIAMHDCGQCSSCGRKG